MGRPLKKWPSYALWALEDVLLHLREIRTLSKQAQVAAQQGNFAQAVILNGDIRERSDDATNLLVQAKTGNYERDAITAT